MTDHECPPFEAVEPHGATGFIDILVTPNSVLHVVQDVVNFKGPEWKDVTYLWAELLVDENVVAISNPVKWLEQRQLQFDFPPMMLQPQTVGVRYVARLKDGHTRRILFEAIK